MGRPSLADVRRPQILDAFEVCIVQYGLAGSSLERIAEEAGVKRSLIRHYFGSRANLTEALMERVMLDVVDGYRRAITEAGAAGGLDALVGFFTGPAFAGDPQDAVIDALMDEAHRDAGAREILRRNYKALLTHTEAELVRLCPDAADDDVATVAYALVCVGIGNVDMYTIRLRARQRGHAERAARVLAGNLLTP